jgi:YidC/Oxa1 family membrane protein insertase
VSNPLNYLYELVAWVLKQIYAGLSPLFGTTSGWTWAFSIIILVVIMRLIMVPLFIKQMHTTRAMSALAPEMAVLRKKYKDDKQTLQQETMKLYQSAGVNPLMGCLPVALQLPLFFALFSVLKAITEWTHGPPKYGLTLQMVESAQKTKILGATVGDKVLFTDGLHVPVEAKIVIVIAVLISATTTYLTIRQSMKRGMMPAATPDNPMASSQKFMAYIMPLFALSGLYWQFGLVLYWVTTNVWTLGQQWLMFRKQPQPRAADGGAVAVAGAAPGPALTGRATTGTPKRADQPAAAGSKPGPGGASQKGSQRQGAGSAQSARGSRNAQSGQAQRPARPGARQSPGRDGQQRDGQPSVPASIAASSANGGGLLRRLGRSRTEPEPEPQEPEVKIVRQQPQRQSRSKRSGGKR